jgi:catechol 2,3-dioxygenase-like lactoylglutathione lyase family enzyme
MRIGQIILRVGDLDMSVHFWTEVVGFNLSMRAGTFAYLDGETIQLTLNQVDDRLVDQSLTEIVIEFEDVENAHRELSERGVPFAVDLRPVTSDGSRDLLAAHFVDPDGHLASVVGWVDQP